jgi:hypothetical protein
MGDFEAIDHSIVSHGYPGTSPLSGADQLLPDKACGRADGWPGSEKISIPQVGADSPVNQREAATPI